MSRLIDADKLIEHLKKFYDDCDIEDGRYYAFEDAIRIVRVGGIDEKTS